jgi:hypothetical protein
MRDLSRIEKFPSYPPQTLMNRDSLCRTHTNAGVRKMRNPLNNPADGKRRSRAVVVKIKHRRLFTGAEIHPIFHSSASGELLLC